MLNRRKHRQSPIYPTLPKSWIQVIHRVILFVAYPVADQA